MSTFTIDTNTYPEDWSKFIGQTSAVRQLKVAAHSALTRREAMDHVLLASGTPGIGKSSLAMLIANEIVGDLHMVSGKVTVDEARILFSGMEDFDILFIDECHQLVSGRRTDAEWLLHVLQDGMLMGPNGPEEIPKVTVIGATTDVGRLPETIIGRFPIRPPLFPYSTDEARQIVRIMSQPRLVAHGLPEPDEDTVAAIAEAGNHNPRLMSAILTGLRDLSLVEPGAAYDLTEPLEWLGLTEDGLDDVCQRYLVALLLDFKGLAGQRALADRLQEPAGLHIAERILMDKGLISKTSRGRTLTKDGISRAKALA